MLLRITLFIGLFFVFNLRAQESGSHFFTGLVPVSEIDTLSREDFLEIYRAQPAAFSQPLYTYGYEDSSAWELVIDAYMDYPEIVQPVVHQADVNADGEKDLVLSFYAGHEYSFIGFYVRKKEVYTCVFTDNGQFYGVYDNGDVCYEKPACCNDLTDEYYRISINEMDSVKEVGELAIPVDQ